MRQIMLQQYFKVKILLPNEFTNEEIDDAITYLNKRMEQISGDVEPYFLQQYSNSVIS